MQESARHICDVKRPRPRNESSLVLEPHEI